MLKEKLKKEIISQIVSSEVTLYSNAFGALGFIADDI